MFSSEKRGLLTLRWIWGCTSERDDWLAQGRRQVYRSLSLFSPDIKLLYFVLLCLKHVLLMLFQLFATIIIFCFLYLMQRCVLAGSACGKQVLLVPLHLPSDLLCCPYICVECFLQQPSQMSWGHICCLYLECCLVCTTTPLSCC